jgi:hypothetical protein
MKKYLGGGKIYSDGKISKFKSPFMMSVHAFGKFWVLDTSRCSDERLTFVPAKHGGYKGGSNYLKRWRLRTDVAKPNGEYKKWTQKDAADHFGVSQSYIAKIEKGEKDIPMRFSKTIL